jgi:predicted amidohydrolase
MPEYLNVERNLEVLETMARKAAAEGVELLRTCECYLDGYCAHLEEVDQEKLRSVSLADDSPVLEKIRSLCRELHMGMIVGYSAIAADGLRNTAMLIGTDGKEIGRYEKIHLHAHDLKYVPGDGFPVFDTEWGKIGMLICADRRWPEAARTLKCKGAEMILIPTYGFHGERNQWWMCTRSYENECFVAFAHPEQSFVCNPDGFVEAYLESSAPGILVHDIDVSKCKTEMFKYRREDIYFK